MAYKPHSMPELLKATEWSDPSGLRRVLANVAAQGDERQIMRNLRRDDIRAEDIDLYGGPMGIGEVTPPFTGTVSVKESIDFGSHDKADYRPWGAGTVPKAEDGPAVKTLRTTRGQK